MNASQSPAAARLARSRGAAARRSRDPPARGEAGPARRRRDRGRAEPGRAAGLSAVRTPITASSGPPMNRAAASQNDLRAICHSRRTMRSTRLSPTEVRIPCTCAGTFSATAGFVLARALFKRTPTSGTETITLRPPSENRLAWAARAARPNEGLEARGRHRATGGGEYEGTKGREVGLSRMTASVSLSATKEATRGSARLLASRSANASG